MYKRIAALLPLLVLTSCAVKVTEPVEVVIQQPLAVTLTDGATPGNAKHEVLALVPDGPLGKPVRQIAEQIDTSLSQRGIKTLAIAIAPFVDLNQPAAHRGFGEELAEGFYHELQARGYNLIDHRALPFTEPGAADPSLKLAEYYRQHRVSYVLSGTFNAHPEGVSVNARMFDTVTRQVVATGRSLVPTAVLEGALPGYDPMSSRDGLIIENGGVPVR